MSDNVVPIANKLEAMEWNWEVFPLDNLVEIFSLTDLKKTEGRMSFVDPFGHAWNIYIDRGQPIFVEVTFDIDESAKFVSGSAYDDKIDEYFEKFEDEVKRLHGVLGPPEFLDGAAARGFPEDQEANWLALWTRNGTRFMFEQKHEGPSFPFRLCLVVAPEEPRQFS